MPENVAVHPSRSPCQHPLGQAGGWREVFAIQLAAVYDF